MQNSRHFVHRIDRWGFLLDPYSAFASLTLAFSLWSLATTATAQSLDVVIQSGHLAEIRDVSYSPDGCYIATAGADNRVKLWDESTGMEIRSFRGGNRPHSDVTFSADGRSVFIAVEGGIVTQRRTVSGESIREFATDESTSVAFDGRRARMLTTGGTIGSKQEIVLWDTTSGSRLHTYEWPTAGVGPTPQFDERHRSLRHEPNKVAMSPRGDYFATAGQEGRTVLWRVGKNVPVRFFNLDAVLDEDPGFWERVGQIWHIVVAFSPNGRYLAGAFSNRGFLWPVDPGDRQIALNGHNSAITSIEFSEDGKFVATGSNGGIVKIWDTASGRELQSFPAHAGAVYSMAFKPVGDQVRCSARLATTNAPLSGHILVTGGADSVARMWSLGSKSLIRALAPKVQPLNDVVFSPDSTKLAIASSAAPNGTVKIWDLTTGYDVTSISGHKGGVNAVRFSPDGQWLATAGVDNTTGLWDAGTLSLQFRIGKQARPRKVNDILSALAGIAILSNKDLAGFIGNSSISSSLSITKHSTREGARALAFSGDGRYLAMGGTRRTKLWDFENAKVVQTRFANDSADKLVFSPDDRELLAGGIGAFRLSVETGKELKKLANKYFGKKGGVSTVDLHPGGEKFAVAFSKGRIAVEMFFDGDDWHAYQRGLPARSLKFSSDGTLLAVGDEGGNILIFEIGDGMKLKKEWNGHTDIVFGLDFSPDNGLLASAGADGTVHLWDTSSWEKKLSFVSIGPEDFVILAPDNYYAASTNGHVGLAFRMGNVLYPFEQFDLQLNRPDLVFSRLDSVSEALVDGYRSAYEKRLKRLNISDTDAGQLNQLPRIRIRDLPRRAATSEKNLTFSIEANDRQYSINNINVWVNDVPLYGSQGYLPTGSQRTVRHRVNLELSAGRNKVQVSATNSRGLESVRATLETIYEPPNIHKPDLYVIAIGVSDYGNDEVNLEFAAKDAKDLIRQLKKQDRFREIREILLTDGQATRERILDLKPILQNTRVDDEVVLFVAGHGVVDSNLDYYFATSDMDFNNPSVRGLSDERLEWLLDGIPARRKLLLMDTCYSGEIDPEAMAEPITGVAEKVTARRVRGVQTVGHAPSTTQVDAFLLMQKMFANLGRGSGAVVISAAGGNEFAFEGEKSTNGVFTYSVIEAIGRTKDDDYLRLSQLRQQVVTRVRELTGGLQTPSIRRVNLEFDYPIYSLNEPQISDIPEIDTSDFGKLFVQAAEQSVLEEY